MKRPLLIVYPGSFNPVHYGHIAIARYLAQSEEVARVLVLPSPKNPCKDPSILSDPGARLAAAEEAFKELAPKVLVADTEYHLPRPLYTIRTLSHIQSLYPDYELVLAIGADNAESLHRWYDWEDLLRCYRLWVYPRQGTDGEVVCRRLNEIPGIRGITFLAEAPLYDISSTMIREGKA